MAFLRVRRCRPEIMDQPDLDRERHWHALRGLARINRWSGSASILWPAVRELAREIDRPPRILDVATGGGDVPLRLWQRGRRHGLALEVHGCDRSGAAVVFAQERAAQARAPLRFFPLDVLHDPLPGDFDVVTCSLFLHHLAEEEGIALLRKMKEAARHLVLINDLRRSVPAWLFAWTGTRLLTRSSVVHVDGPRSVAAAFRRAELLALAEKAGLEGATLCRRWPFRWLLAWRERSPTAPR